MSYTEKLLKLIIENPNLEVVPMVDYEVVSGDDYTYWMGAWGDSKIDYIHVPDKETGKYLDEERVYFKQTDEESIKDDIFFYLENKYPDYTDEQLEKLTEKEYKKIEWKKVILVYIGLP